MNIKVEEILHEKIEDIWDDFNDTPRVFVELYDGIVEGTGRSTLLSHFYWDFQRRFPQIPVLMQHHLGLVRFDNDTHLEHLARVLWSVYDMCDGTFPSDELAKMGLGVTNNIFNFLSVNIEEYVTSSSMMDYEELMTDGDLLKMIEEAEQTYEGLDKATSQIRTYLEMPNKYTNNSLKRNCMAGVVNWGQLIQQIAFRGFATDRNYKFFHYPIMRGFAGGLTQFEHFFMETRSGTKALEAQDAPLQTTEYFNRRSQIAASTITGYCEDEDNYVFATED